MPRSSSPAGTAPPATAATTEETGTPTGSGDVYTMAEAARLKGVSYHTVSRAVRRGKLPAHRLGRMALIASGDLRDWRPMRERAPRKYRRREPNPDASPALLDLASGERVDLARRLSTLYELIHEAAAELPLPEFLSLLADRLANALAFRRVAIWGLDLPSGRATRLATFGPPFSRHPDDMLLADLPILSRGLEAGGATVIPDVGDLGVKRRPEVYPVRSLFVAPMRLGGDVLGAIIGDCNGETFTLSEDQLGLAQGMANQAALALERVRLRADEDSRADRLAAILENVSDAVFASDAAGHLTLINAAGRSLLGIGDDSLIPDDDIVDIVSRVTRHGFDGRPIPPEEVPLVRAARGERVRDRQHVVVRPDGGERSISVNAEPIYDGSGRLAGAVAVARNISAERAAATRDAERLSQLEAAAARAAAVADLALSVNAGTDLPTTLRTAITAMTDLLGGRHGAIFFRDADGRMTGQVGYRFPGAATEIELDPAAVPTTMIAFARRAPLYYTYADAAPSEREWFDRFGFRAAIIAPLLRGDELIGVAYVNHAADDRRPSDEEMSFAGALAGQCAVAIDKTRLMDRMESAHRRLLAVVDQLPQGIVIVESPGGRLVLANRAAEDLWGAPLPEAGGSALAQGLADADGVPFPPSQDPLSLTIASGTGRFGESLTILRADGGRIGVLANHAPIVDAAGRIVGAVGVLQNIAQLRALDRAKDDFLSVAAHELRNPLTTLHGNVQLLLRRVQRDPERIDDASRLEGIIVQSERLARLVDRLLDVSRAELGRLDLEVSPSDAAVVVRRVVEEACGSATDLRIEADAPDRLPVVWDALRIEQVLANLVGNAIKYAPDGELRVTLEDATEDGQVRIAVRDHGPGIPDREKSRLFDRYYRAGSAALADDSANGLGLGLYISRLIARAHGGELTVADAPGGGSVFTLTVPRFPAKGETSPPPASRAVSATATATT